MKTMKKGNDIVRISDDKYKTYLSNGYTYTSKSEWKEKIRDVSKKVTEKKDKKEKL